MDNGGMWQSCWWGTDNSNNNQHVSPPRVNLVHQDSNSSTRPHQAGQRLGESGDGTGAVTVTVTVTVAVTAVADTEKGGVTVTVTVTVAVTAVAETWI